MKLPQSWFRTGFALAIALVGPWCCTPVLAQSLFEIPTDTHAPAPVADSVPLHVVLHAHDAGRLVQVIQASAVATLVLNGVALWKQEPRNRAQRAARARPPTFSESWARFTANGQAIRRLAAIGLGPQDIDSIVKLRASHPIVDGREFGSLVQSIGPSAARLQIGAAAGQRDK